MDNFILPEMAEFNVTCHTTGCENSEIVILINAVADSPYIICGPCGNQITDIVNV